MDAQVVIYQIVVVIFALPYGIGYECNEEIVLIMIEKQQLCGLAIILVPNNL